MPFLEDQQTGGFVQGVDVSTPRDEAGFIEDLVPAAFRMENTIGSALNRPRGFSEEAEGPFDPFSHIPEGMGDFADSYVNANSVVEVDAITRRLERELEDKRMLSESGLAGFAAGFAAGVVDPINLVPVGGTAYRVAKTGSTILNGGMVTARAGFLGITAQEAALQATQETRTMGESVTNVAVGTFLSGVLGSAVSAIPVVRGDFDTAGLMAQIERDLTVTDDAVPATGMDSTGAMSARATLEEEGLAGNKAFDTALQAVRWQDPLLRMQTSASAAARRLIQDLAETPLSLQKNRSGVATELSVDRQVRNWNGHLVRTLTTFDNAYAAYAGKTGPAAVLRGSTAARFSGGQKLTYAQFKEEAAKAARRGDDHAIPEVARAAQAYRDLAEELKNHAIDLGLMDESVDVKTALSYVTRIYDTDKMLANRGEVIDKFADFYRRRSMEAETRMAAYAAERKKMVKSVGDLKAKLESKFTKEAKAEVLEELRAAQKALKELEHQRKKDELDIDMDDAERRMLAEQTFNRILATPAGRLPYDMDFSVQSLRGRGPNNPDLSGPFKHRAFLIEDEVVEPYLVNDIESISKTMVRTIAPDIELVRKFGRDMTLTDSLRDIEMDYDRLMAGVKNPKYLKRLQAQKERDIKDALAVRDRIRGMHGMPADPTALTVRAGRAMRHLNYVRLLGGMTVSAIPDLARVAMVHGVGNNFRDAILPMIRNFSQVKLAARELRDLGLASDMVLNSRMQAFANISDDFGRNSKFERALGGVADTFGMVSLMAPWNQALKSIAGITSMQRMHRAMKADVAGTISKKELEYLRSASISLDDSKAILAQIEKHGGTEDGVLAPNSLAWDDVNARTRFQSAVGRDIDRIIITPGQDQPLIATGSELGKMAFQFKSFAIAATQRMLLSGLQQRDMATVNGLMLSTALGMLSYWAKQTNAGQDISDDPRVWIKEGVDRSGVTGWFFEANNMVEKATRGHVGVSALMGGPPLSRYASRNIAGALFGPTFGTIQSMASAIGNTSAAVLGDESIKSSDVTAMRRLLPYQNVFYARWLFDQMEAGLSGAIGATD